MIKKKFLIPLFFTGLLAMNTAFAASEKVIPYPAGLDTTTEGASSAPKEINHSDSKYFKENDFYEMTPSETLILLKNYPTYQQTTEYTCGPAAGLTVLNFYDNKNFDEMTLKNGMKTQGYPIGTNAADMAKFFEGIGWYVDSSLKHEPFETYEAFGEWIVDTLEQNTPLFTATRLHVRIFVFYLSKIISRNSENSGSFICVNILRLNETSNALQPFNYLVCHHRSKNTHFLIVHITISLKFYGAKVTFFFRKHSVCKKKVVY